MKWITIEEVNELVAKVKVVGMEVRDVFNTTFSTNWTMHGLVLEDGSFIGIYPEDDQPSYLLFEDGK